MMKKQITILIFVLLVLISGVGIVSAETLTGTLGSDSWNSTIYDIGSVSGAAAYPSTLTFWDIEKSENIASLILFFSQIKPSFDAGAPSGAYTPVTLRWLNSSGTVIGHGTLGYYRVFNNDAPPVEQLNGYLWLTVDDFNTTGLSGNQVVYADYNHSALYNISTINYGGQTGSGLVKWDTGSWGIAGQYVLNKESVIFQSYEATKPGGLGISGTVNKDNTYSRIFITGVSSQTLISESIQNKDQFNFTTNASQIHICALDVVGNWYNSSLLFSPGSATSTPTPTPTPTPTVTLGPGQFWLTFSAEDATTGGLIPGAEIDIYSEFSGTWDNGTTSSGERTIATSQYHVYDAYGNASGYTAGEALDKIAYPNQNYLIKLFPSSGLPDVPGYVNLFVSVTERETGSPISGVSVSVNTPGSYTETGETDSTGTERFSTSNSSVKYITVSKTGYKSETRTITTPASGSYNAVLQMSRLTVTTVPTSYIPPGGVTPVRTVDPRSDSEKDIDMMNQIRDAGPDLIGLAIAVTFISLLGLMSKGFGK